MIEVPVIAVETAERFMFKFMCRFKFT